MKNFNKGLLILAWISLCFLIFNVIMSYLFQEDIFLKQDSSNPIGYFMLVGFLVILVFFVLSFIWLLNQTSKGKHRPFTSFALLLCSLCIIFMMGQKVMYDEIAREFPLGVAGGEAMILLMLYCIQLAFNVMMIFHLRRLKNSV
jgi:hypothetical protein